MKNKKILISSVIFSLITMNVSPSAKAAYDEVTKYKEPSNVIIDEESVTLDFQYSNSLIHVQESTELNNLESSTFEPTYAWGAVYFVPGIGQAAAVLTGGFLIAGSLYLAGSWLYEAVDSYLTAETADKYISRKKKGSIRNEFPTEYLDKTLNEIEKDAKAGKKSAQKAKKLLTDNRFNK